MTHNLADRKAKIREEIIALQAQLRLITELEEEQAKQNADGLLKIPSVTLTEAAGHAVTALKKFTKEDLELWIRRKYPQIEFSKKSVDHPLSALITDGKVIMLRRNTGNKVPAVYGIKGESEATV